MAVFHWPDNGRYKKDLSPEAMAKCQCGSFHLVHSLKRLNLADGHVYLCEECRKKRPHN